MVADVNKVDKYGRTVLMIANQQKQKKYYSVFCCKNKVNIPKSVGEI